MSAFHRLFYNGRHIHASAPVTSQNDYRQGCGGCYPFKIVVDGDLEPNISAVISTRCRECHQWNQLVCFMVELVAILEQPDRSRLEAFWQIVPVHISYTLSAGKDGLK